MNRFIVFVCLSILTCCSSDPVLAQVSDVYISKGYTEGCGLSGSTPPVLQYILITNPASRWLGPESDLHLGVNRIIRLGTLITDAGPDDFDIWALDSVHVIYDPGHDHYHYFGGDGSGFLTFKLLDCANLSLATSHKIGYQLVNDIKFFPSQCELQYLAPYGGWPDWLRTAPMNPIFNNGRPGISPGFADPYSAQTVFNWLNIEGASNGHYYLFAGINLPVNINQGTNAYPDNFTIPFYLDDPYSISNPPPGLVPDVFTDMPGAIKMGAAIPPISPPSPATNASAAGRTITFSLSTGACSYVIKREVWEKGNWHTDIFIGNTVEVFGSPYVDNTAISGATYRWWVTAKNAGGSAQPAITNKQRINK